jgi:hypothetical protein
MLRCTTDPLAKDGETHVADAERVCLGKYSGRTIPFSRMGEGVGDAEG